MAAVAPLVDEDIIRIPNEWAPTLHQLPLWRAMKPADGLKRGIAIWHRRAGKDSTAINLTCVKAHQEIGTYWHLLPTNVQAKRTVWNETDRHGRRIIEQAFPESIRESTNEGDMSIRLSCGSFWQLGGSDNYNSLVGSNVRGVIFSEWALCDPAAWDYIRPILLENGGWALFIYTPRGRNHGWTLWEQNKDNPRWATSMLTVEDTFREDGTPVISEEMIEQEKEDGASEETIEQEYYCSFAAGVVGAFFARQLEKAREEGRVGSVPWDPRYAVHGYLDIGIDDYTTCWLLQREGWKRKWIRYREWKDTALQDVALELSTWPYRFATINLPHDGKEREKGTLKRLHTYFDDAFEDTGTRIVVHEPYGKQTQIEAGRHLITQSWIDEEECARGLDALLNYQKVFDQKRMTYLETPLHNWASHGADAWMLAGMDDINEPLYEAASTVTRAPQVRVHRSVGGRR